jgi:hypothetical protein
VGQTEAQGAQLGGLAGAVRLAADGGDAASAEAEEVLGGLFGGGDVIDTDVVEAAVADPFTEYD